jgi:hypothetical protein
MGEELERLREQAALIAAGPLPVRSQFLVCAWTRVRRVCE